MEALLEVSGDSCSANLAPFEWCRPESRSTSDRRGLACGILVVVDSSTAVHGRFCGGFMIHPNLNVSASLKKLFSLGA